jgi:Helix-turn-helix domain/zinc-finger of transposase IS204/IS1001/IS1096/IS1165/Helix-turn-helix domain of transposase family ISL3
LSTRRVPKGPGRRPKSLARRRFMELLAEGWSMRAACKEVGISRSIAHIWKNGTTVRLKDGTVKVVPPLEPSSTGVISPRFLSEDERVRIADLAAEGLGPTVIATHLGRSASTISRERRGYCQRCDVLVGLVGLHVTGVDRTEDGLRVHVESGPVVVGCPSCGVVAHGHGRQTVELIDAPCFASPVRLWWRKRRFRCPEPLCPVTSFMEQDPDIAPARGLLTRRATGWAVGQMPRENASVQGLARQLGCSWKTLWRSVRPVLEAAAADEDRFVGSAV